MELDRPPHHRTTSSGTASSTSSELFICFTSRLSSSSSMKIAKSILSPGRARDPPSSLSTSLSRRLRSNGGIKGGGQASPMFPTGGGKKRGCAFENPEPSSPKVTCIGQVRVKTKKKVKQTRSLSRRRSAGEVSFRRVEQLGNDELKNSSSKELGSCNNRSQQFQQQQEGLTHRNQRWVHLPETICEALRAFGAEFSCLFPCRSTSCFSTNDREKEEKAGNNTQRGEGNDGTNGQSSCGAVFARWFVSLQDSEGGKGREIELVVGGGDEEEVRERTSMRSSRRHVFEDIEFKEEEMIAVNKGEEEEEEDEEKARVSICIPPKNALLLMRCRSDPMKMATLGNRFWESPAPNDEDENENETEEEDEDEEICEGNEESEEVFEKEPEFVNEVAVVEMEERGGVVEMLVSGERNEEEEEEMDKDAILADEIQKFVEELVQEEKLSRHSSEELEESEGAMLALLPSEDADDDAGEETDLHSLENDILLDEERAENMQQENLIRGEIEEEENEEQSMPISFDSLSSEENSDREEKDTEIGAQKEAATEQFLPVEEAELEAKTDESIFEEIPLETSTSLNGEETVNDEAIQTLTTKLLLSVPDDAEKASEDEKINQIQATDGQESQEPPKECDDGDEGDDENDETKVTATEKETTPVKKEESSSNVLPDCLLLMMCEPKLSMEVSKETWVCSTDFTRWLPERRPPVNHKRLLVNAPHNDSAKKKVSCNESNPPPPMGPQLPQHQREVLLPPRSSCSLPAAAVSMAAMIEQKLVNAVAYEPFVLTRCKSEPMRTAAAKLMPEACFWKNRKLEPHRSATFGVGAAGVGF